MSIEDGRFAGIPDPNKMDYFDPNVELADLRPTNIARVAETTDGNPVRNHSERLGESNASESRHFSMSPGKEYSIEQSMIEQARAWNTRFE